MGAAVQRSYTLEEREAGLAALAIWHGNSQQAARVLKEQGTEIPARTLLNWKAAHPQRYAELQEQIVPRVREKLAQQFEVIGLRSAELTLKSLDEYDDKLGQLDAKDLASAIRNISTAGATPPLPLFVRMEMVQLRRPAAWDRGYWPISSRT